VHHFIGTYGYLAMQAPGYAIGVIIVLAIAPGAGKACMRLGRAGGQVVGEG
jgi:hypothetical protein